MKSYIKRVMSLIIAVTLLLSCLSCYADGSSTAEPDIICQHDEHAHSESCYERVLVCNQEEIEDRKEFVGKFIVHKHNDNCKNAAGEIKCGFIENEYYHVHNEYCRDENGDLVCGLVTKRPHEHTDECYTIEKELTCEKEEQEGHSHGEACYKPVETLICTIPESDGHTHTDSCYKDSHVLVCGLEENEDHEHNDDCYENRKELICELQESEGHHHAEGCYKTDYELICDQEEKEPHTHDETCFTEKKKLVCDKPVTKHIHTESCYNGKKFPGCGEEEIQTFTCTEKDWVTIQGHTHTDECYETVRVCEKEEHIHTEDCYRTEEEAVPDEDNSVLEGTDAQAIHENATEGSEISEEESLQEDPECSDNIADDSNKTDATLQTGPEEPIEDADNDEKDTSEQSENDEPDNEQVISPESTDTETVPSDSEADPQEEPVEEQPEETEAEPEQTNEEAEKPEEKPEITEDKQLEPVETENKPDETDNKPEETEIKPNETYDNLDKPDDNMPVSEENQVIPDENEDGEDKEKEQDDTTEEGQDPVDTEVTAPEENKSDENKEDESAPEPGAEETLQPEPAEESETHSADAPVDEIPETTDHEIASDSANEPAEEAEADPETNTEESTEEAPAVILLQTKEGSPITASVTIPAGAEIPEDTELVVGEKQEAEPVRKSAAKSPKSALMKASDEKTLTIGTLETLSYEASPKILLYNRTLEMSLVSGGKEVEPKQGVFVHVEVYLSDVRDGQDVEVWHLTGEGETLLESTNDNGHISFDTDSFSVFEFRTQAKQVASWATENMEIADWGITTPEEPPRETVIANIEEGLTVLDSYMLPSTETDWITVRRNSDIELGELESVSLYAVENDTLGGIIKEEVSTDETLLFNSNEVSSFALVLDSGYRMKEQELGNVVLSGMMPKAAEAVVEEVTENYLPEDFEIPEEVEEGYVAIWPEVLDAYDISIMDANGEYQPNEARPIDVTIYDDRITADATLQVWHIQDDGTKEQVEEFEVENGFVRFTATGFSAYAIVECQPSVPISYYQIDALDSIALQNGVYIGHWDNYWFTNTIEQNVGGTIGRMGIFKTKPASSNPFMDGAIVYYFVPVDAENNLYKIYCYDQNHNIQYVHWETGSDAVKKSLTFSDAASATTFEVLSFDGTTEGAYKIHAVGSAYYWNMRGGASGNSFAAYNNASDVNAKLKFVYQSDVTSDPYNFGESEYGILFWSGSVTGKAMMAEPLNENALSAKVLTVLTEKDHYEDKLFVPDQSDIAMWNLHWVGGIEYRISTTVNGETKYLQVTHDGIRLVEEAESTRVTIHVGSGTHAGQFYITADGVTLTYGDTSTGFSTGGTAGSEWLYLVRESELTADYYMTYSAQKVSVSDSEVTNGSRIIVYARIWNYETDRYEFYALDHDGGLVRCFEDGDSIEWIGNRINTLLWNFVEYYWEGTNDPNYYYELYNQYSEKYISPRLASTALLSPNPIGINLNGRRRGRYYTSILAWDEMSQVYAGLKLEDDGDGHVSVVPCGKDEATDFYFAILQDIPVDDETTTVPTVDHTQYGITMKMKDFTTRSDMSTFLGSDAGGMGTTLHQGLLSTNLGSDGYPTTAGGSLGTLYSGAEEVNHLFIQSTYSGTGYYEYDSSQNFASLNGATGGDFTVYREIGTYDSVGERVTLKHGQFFPYNTIKPGVFATLNGKNLYDVHGNELSENYPRKHESLYLLQPKPGDSMVDCYFGMEIEASFVQTPSGYDAWGHDIIYEFTGDDDFWLYVDGELVIDLGGIHSAVPGSVNYHTGDVVVNGVHTTLRDVFYNNYRKRGHSVSESQAYVDDLFMEKTDTNGRTYYTFKDYTTHTMRIFYMERGAGASNLHMRFNLASVKDGHVELSKEIDGVDETESMMADFPYQIWYMLPDDDMDADNPIERLLIPNNSDGISVTYKDSDMEVPYEESFEISGEDDQGVPYSMTYEHVFLLKPGDVVDIDLPDDTITYRIVECGINTDVYSSVAVNDGDEPVSEITGASYPANRKDYGIAQAEAKYRARVSYVNTVDPSALRTLTIKKVLLDEQGENEVRNDAETFSFRLYLGSEFGPELDLVSMYAYHVRDENGNYCTWNIGSQRFTPLGEGKDDYTALTLEEKKACTILTSIYGTISNIPSFYTVEVRELLVGTTYKIEEQDSSIPKGYTRQKYIYYEDIGDPTGVDSLTPVTGLIETGKDPLVKVSNLKGYGIAVNKVWDDEAYIAERDDAYFAMYYETNGELQLAGALVEHPVLRLPREDSDLYWYIEHLAPNTVFSQYKIYEVSLENPVTDADGYITGYDSITRIENNGKITINGRLAGDTQTLPCEYTVIYGDPVTDPQNANVKSYTITNERAGVTFVKEDMEGNRLENAEFVLTDEDGNVRYEYTSDGNGLITKAFLRENVEYTLEETKSPHTYRGYFGLQEAMKIMLVDGRITVTSGDSRYYEVSEDGQTITIKNRVYYLQVIKTDKETGEPLRGAHFKLHKQITVGGYTGFDFDPMPGYEDMVSGADGTIPLLNNTLLPGTYELREITAPTGYADLTSYIQFTISPLGILTLGRHPAEVTLDSEIQPDTSVQYTITVPNLQIERVSSLTINKTVNGSMGDRSREFVFTLTSVEDETAGTAYPFVKTHANGTTENGFIETSGSFLLAHGDSMRIVFPREKQIVITETREQYISAWSQDENDVITSNIITVELTADSVVSVTNTLNAVAPTGYTNRPVPSLVLVAFAIAIISLIAYRGIMFTGFDIEKENKRKGKKS